MRQTSTQKKNNMRSMIIVALLLLLVAVIGFGGYTLSKFVSEKSEAGTAQVAKWGYTLKADATKLFGENYKLDGDKSIVASAEDTSFTVSASTATNANLVAPGTTGSMTFSVKGNAEVKAKLNIEFTATSDIVLNYTKDGVAGTAYTPVKWTLKKGTEVVKAGTLAEIAAELNDNKYDVTYDANVEEINDVYTLSWEWAFGTDQVTENDHLDTLLGMIANSAESTTNATTNGKYVATEGTSTKIEFTLKLSVVQLAE